MAKQKKTGSFGLTGGWGELDTAGNGSPKNKPGNSINFRTEPDANKEMAPSMAKSKGKGNSKPPSGNNGMNASNKY